MAQRQQVMLRDPEYRKILRAARSCKMSIADWVRQALAGALRQEREVGKTLEIIRAAAKHEFPTGDIDSILAEIEQGYRKPGLS